MKQLSALLLITVVITSSSFSISNPGKVEVVFNRQLNFNDLVKIKMEIADKGILLDYKRMEFDNNGKLKSISFKVDCKDGFSGSASSEELSNDSRFGFYRDYSKDAASPFGTGGLS